MNIFDFDDYKDFLRETIAKLPKKGRGEVNKMAANLNVHPTLISQVLGGDRDFSPEQIHKLCGYLGLQGLESDYLILLLQFERAGTGDLKKYYQSKLSEIKKSSLSIATRLSKERTLTDLDRSVFYSSWIYLATWLFCSIDEGKTVDDVSNKFSITRKIASDVLNFLKHAQLCLENDGVFKMTSQHIHLEFGSAFLARHHSNWRVKGLQRIEDLTDEEMMFTSPFSISKKDFLHVREELMKAIKSTSQLIKDSPAEDVACMNIDLFWIKK